MKTLLSILMIALFGAMVSANPGSKTDYIVTKDGKVLVAKLSLGVFKLHAKADGEKFKVNYKDVVSFQHDGAIYEKKPLYNGRECSGCMVFMRLVSWRNGYGLYSYEDPEAAITNSKRYFVFKGENTLWLEVTEKNAESISNFFNKL
jgi:hypothetical protein